MIFVCRHTRMPFSAGLILVITLVTVENNTLASTDGGTNTTILNSRTTELFTESPTTDPQSPVTSAIASATQKSSPLVSTVGPPTTPMSQTLETTPSEPSSTYQSEPSTSLHSTLTTTSFSSRPTETNETSVPIQHQTSRMVSSVTSGSWPPSTTQRLDIGLTYQEKIITIIVSLVLALIVLVMVMVIIARYRKRRCLFIHQRLYNNTEDMVSRFSTSDDTLVVSGGLYDGPQIFSSPGETLEYEEFPSRSSQVQLEFFNQAQGPPHSYMTQ